MTHNLATGSSSSDRREHDEQHGSNEIRADINQTRASVGDKIDQLQARLDPSRLKQQAQETVQEMLSDTANSMTDYVRTHKDEMVSSLADAARRNPLPTALVGLGVGWLLLESMGGSRSHSDRDNRRYEYERRNFRSQADSSRFEGSTGRSFVAQGRGQYVEGESYSPSYYETPEYGSSGYQGSPGYDREYSQEYGNGHQRNPLAKAADAVKDTVSDVGHEIKERVEEAGQEIKERVGNIRDDIQGRTEGRMDEVRYQQWQMSNQMQRSMGRAEERMDEWQRRVRHEGQRRGQQVMRNLEDNPLTYGALALAAGAAIALLLPQTRTENRAFGEARDQIMEKGQEVMESAKSHAQEMANEIRPELEEKARQIVSDVKEKGKEVVQEAAEELRPVVDKAMEKGKQEVRNVAQESGVDPDKLTGSKSTLNRDTLAGQWKQVQGDAKSKWGKLTDDELTRIEGDYEKLVGAIQTRYGYTRGQVEREINDFFNSRNSQSRKA